MLLMNILKFFLPDNSSSKIGLCQFREQATPVVKKNSSIKNKDVKLSDLMRRVS